jgi:hypothetical protein
MRAVNLKEIEIGMENFILGGDSFFTVKNLLRDQRFTYHVQQCENKPTLYFVKVLNGPDNTRNYRFFGILVKENNQVKYFFSRKSAKIAWNTPSVEFFQEFWNNRKNLNQYWETWSEGKCCKCHRKLTSEWANVGIGPVCAGKA